MKPRRERAAQRKRLRRAARTVVAVWAAIKVAGAGPLGLQRLEAAIQELEVSLGGEDQ